MRDISSVQIQTMEAKPQATTLQVAMILSTGVLVVLGSLGFSRFSMSLIFPYMRQGLALTYAQIGVIATCNFLGYLIFSFGSGIAASRVGPRRIISISLLLTGLAMVTTGLGSGFWWPLICLTLVGVGSAGANIPIMAMATSWVSPQRRGIASGFLVMGSGLGLFINGITIPRWVTAPGGEGWRSAWIWLGIATIVIAIWAGLVLRDRPGVSQRETTSDKTEKRPTILEGIIRIFKEKPVLLRLAWVYFAFGFSYVIFTTFFGMYLTETRGWSTFDAGRLWRWVGIFSLPSGFIWGWVSDRVGRRWGLFVVYLMHGLCLIGFATFPWNTGITVVALVYGSSIFSIPAIMNAACGDEVGSQLAPTAFGAVTVTFGLGQMAAPALAGVMLDWGWGMQQNLWLSAIVALLGALGAALLHTALPFGSSQHNQSR
ncbi:MAG: MFS transporter [Desulfitobacteriaceae bacterium]